MSLSKDCIVKIMWGKRYNRGVDHEKRWHIWVSCLAAKLFCLCTVSEVSRMCLWWQVRESVGAVAFPVLSLKSRQIKPYLPQRITLLCTGILRRVSAHEPIYGAFPAKPGKLPQERRTANLGRFWPETRRGSLRGICPPLRRMPASRLSGRRPTPTPAFRRFCEALPRTP